MKKLSPVTLDQLQSVLPPRPRDSHKGLYGSVLAVGGDFGTAGAVRLAAEAALRVGAGLVHVATQPDHVPIVLSGRPEIMAHGITKSKELKPFLKKTNVIVVGPGLGQTVWSTGLWRLCLASRTAMVVDADGLNLLAKKPIHSDRWVLTPHPGEAARLLGWSIQDIQKDRFYAAMQLQQKYGGVIVLKGAGTIVCTSEAWSICDAGNPGMSSAGMGDVLSGIIAGLLAQHVSLQDAARWAVLIHAMAGDRAAKIQGERGLLASDLMSYLQALVNI